MCDAERRARYDEVGADLGEGEDDEMGLDDLGPWREIKVPFTAFRDRSFFDRVRQAVSIHRPLALRSLA